MTVEQFAQWASDYATQHGVRPKSISMTKAHIRELYDDLDSSNSTKSVHPSRVSQFLGEHGDKNVDANGFANTRYALTLLGVDVYCE